MAVGPLRVGTTGARGEAGARTPSDGAGAPPRVPVPETGVALTRPAPSGPRPRPAPRHPWKAPLLALAGLLLVAGAAYVRPAPYGDHLVRYASADGGVHLRARRGVVEAYGEDGAPRWRYGREGRRPVAVRRVAGEALAMWSDGMVTDTDGAGAVRWHRGVPGAAAWLRTPGARGGRGVLQPLGPAARMLAVVTRDRVAAYRVADGDLRWVLPAREGCAFAPAAAVRRGGALLIAQPCADDTVAWSERIVAVDGLGRIVPGRTPLGNDLPGGPRPGAPGNPLASPR